MHRIFIATAFGVCLTTSGNAQDICSPEEAYRFGHEGREIPAVCAGNTQYDQEYSRGSHDGRAAIMGTVAAGAIMEDMLDNDDDFFYHTHHHRHDGFEHTHRHRHHNSHGGEAHGMHGSHHDHNREFSGGHHGGHSGGHFGGGHRGAFHRH